MAIRNAGLRLIAGVQDLVALLGALAVLICAALRVPPCRAALPFKMPAWPLPPLAALGLYVPPVERAAVWAVLAAGVARGTPRQT